MPEFPRTVKDIARLIGRNEDTVLLRLSSSQRILGVRVKFFREKKKRGCSYQISEESYQAILKKVPNS